MIMFLLVITNARVNLEGCAHLSTADFTVLHQTADSSLPGDGGRQVLDLVLVDDHPHPVGRDVLLGDGDGLDVAVPALDAPLDALRQLPDVLQFLHSLSIVWPHQSGDTDLFYPLLPQLRMFSKERGAQSGTVVTTATPTATR